MKLLNNLKFGAKLWFFASVMIGALIIVAATSIVSSNRIVKSGDEFSVISENSRDFLRRQIDHLNWVSNIEKTFMENHETLEVETDHTKCKLGKYLFGSDGKSLLEHYPELRARMNDLIESHEKLHTSAKGIQSSWAQIHPGLKESLSARLDEHRIWALTLACDIINNEPITVESNPDACKFGKWLQGPEARELAASWSEFDRILKEVAKEHRELHETAKQIASAKDYDEKIAIFRNTTRPKLDSIIVSFSKLQSLEDTLVQSQKNALAIFQDETLPILEITQDKLNGIIEYLHTQEGKIRTKMDATASMATMSSIIISLAALVSAVFISLLIIKLVTTPIQKCVDLTGQLSNGDFTVSIDIDQKDEIGDLAKSLNSMVGELRSGFAEIHDGVGSLASSTTELTAISTQLAGNANDTSEVSTTVAASTEQTSQNMNVVASAIEEISANLSSLATASEEMTATIDEIAKNAERSREVTEKAVTKVGATAKQMAELGTAAKLIGSITDTIKGISEQTNLLALNATIEAASAGEAGKGFAVVANEIKELSKQTANATEQISQSIENIQNRTDISIQEIDGIVEIINEIDSVTTMIASAVEEQSNTSSEIANNVSQSADGIQEVTRNVAQVNDVSLQTAQDVNKVSSAARDIAAASNQLSSSANEISEFAETLNRISSRYKV